MKKIATSIFLFSIFSASAFSQATNAPDPNQNEISFSCFDGYGVWIETPDKKKIGADFDLNIYRAMKIEPYSFEVSGIADATGETEPSLSARFDGRKTPATGKYIVSFHRPKGSIMEKNYCDISAYKEIKGDLYSIVIDAEVRVDEGGTTTMELDFDPLQEEVEMLKVSGENVKVRLTLLKHSKDPSWKEKKRAYREEISKWYIALGKKLEAIKNKKEQLKK